MVIYSTDKQGFIRDVQAFPQVLRKRLSEKLGEEPGKGEIRSWENSLPHMASVLEDSEIPSDVGVSLEYNIPVTNNRIDFILTGRASDHTGQVIIIELKQWEHVYPTVKDGIVRTRYEGGLKDTVHPSYQAACYASLLYDFKTAPQEGRVALHACAYLHNCVDTETVRNPAYQHYTDRAPVFCKGEEEALRGFIKSHIVEGDGGESLDMLEQSGTRPSKRLMDCVASMAEGNQEFKMVDGQKIVFQNILWAYDEYRRTGQKQVVIVEGGPGTGKSVIAVKLLIEMVGRKCRSRYITKNAAPRRVMCRKLTENRGGQASVESLFKGSGLFYASASDEFDMLIADEAHRLQRHSGANGRMGENQVKEIVNAAKTSVFFVDERQIVSLQDIGTLPELEKWADNANAKVTRLELKTQFRCSGSNEFLDWVEHLLQYDGNKPFKLSGATYELRLFDSPSELMEEIRKRDRGGNRSRVVAGYCWEWKSHEDLSQADIVFNEFGVSYQWNFAKDDIWSITEGSIDQIGCIHTCQGLDFEYVGVIIGNDLLCRGGNVLVNPCARSSDDFTIKGWEQLMKRNPQETKRLLRAIIKNTYRTLMTRGMKGCFLYVCDRELREYVRHYLG